MFRFHWCVLERHAECPAIWSAFTPGGLQWICQCECHDKARAAIAQAKGETA